MSRGNNFSDAIKAAFGVHLAGFHANLYPDTAGVMEFSSRKFKEAAAWAPGRMMDKVEEMLEQWRKADTSGAPQPKTRLPVMIAAMAKEFASTGPEFSRRAMGDGTYVMLNGDPKERVFLMKSVMGDYRTQVAIFAADEPTCKSLAQQLHMYMSAVGNRTFFADYTLAGSIKDKWPIQVENPDMMATAQEVEGVKNLTVMLVDVMLRATIPVLVAPKQGQPNDGKGSGPNQYNPFLPDYDPSGFPVVLRAEGDNYHRAIEGDIKDAEWDVEVEAP